MHATKLKTNQFENKAQASTSSRISNGSLGQIALCIAILFCISLTGCGPKLAATRDVDLTAGEIKSIILDIVDSEQTINIEASAEQPFHLHVYLMENEAALDTEMERGVEQPTLALAGARESTSHKVSASVPGGKEAAVRLESANGQDFTVKLKISN